MSGGDIEKDIEFKALMEPMKNKTGGILDVSTIMTPAMTKLTKVEPIRLIQALEENNHRVGLVLSLITAMCHIEDRVTVFGPEVEELLCRVVL